MNSLHALSDTDGPTDNDQTETKANGAIGREKERTTNERCARQGKKREMNRAQARNVTVKGQGTGTEREGEQEPPGRGWRHGWRHVPLGSPFFYVDVVGVVDVVHTTMIHEEI